MLDLGRVGAAGTSDLSAAPVGSSGASRTKTNISASRTKKNISVTKYGVLDEWYSRGAVSIKGSV